MAMNLGQALVTRGHLYSGGESPLTLGFISVVAAGPISAAKFFFDSVELPDAITLRARFSAVPKTGSGSSSQRGDVPSNWTLSGPHGIIPILTATIFSGDPEVIDLGIANRLKPGAYTLTVVPTIKDSDNGDLGDD